jgi:hypothetical protein
MLDLTGGADKLKVLEILLESREFERKNYEISRFGHLLYCLCRSSRGSGDHISGVYELVYAVHGSAAGDRLSSKPG